MRCLITVSHAVVEKLDYLLATVGLVESLARNFGKFTFKSGVLWSSMQVGAGSEIYWTTSCRGQPVKSSGGTANGHAHQRFPTSIRRALNSEIAVNFDACDNHTLR